MINILIVEDELEQLPFAYAGLIPSVSIDTSTFHIRELVKASKKYYKVETAKSIEIALEKLKKFIPDIVIIDIHLNSTSPYKIGGKELNIGIWRIAMKKYCILQDIVHITKNYPKTNHLILYRNQQAVSGMKTYHIKYHFILKTLQEKSYPPHYP
jgi:DNA-binding NarL/FixJ family response regulator